MKVEVRKATWDDEDQVFEILETFNLERIFNADEFYVAEHEGRVVGCARLKEIENYLELCSVGVVKDYQRLGVGSEIIQSILAKIDHRKVYVVTPHPDYFAKFGFRQIGKDELPAELKDKAEKCEETRGNHWVAMAR